jgi:uncharacterized membrane protein
MNHYILSYIIPVLAVMALLLAFAKYYREGVRFRLAVLLSAGFLLGWASAFISLYFFKLYK